MKQFLMGRWVLVNYSLTGLLVGTALTIAVHRALSGEHWREPPDTHVLWIRVLQWVALVLAGTGVGFFCGIVHLNIQNMSPANQNLRDYDDSVSQYPRPGST